jgi:hypothetical protein
MSDDGGIRDRTTIKRALVYALRHKAFIRWPRGSEREAEMAADRILDHLELSNVRMRMGPPRLGHGTPGDGRQGADGTPFSTRPAWYAIVRGATR